MILCCRLVTLRWEKYSCLAQKALSGIFFNTRKIVCWLMVCLECIRWWVCWLNELIRWEKWQCMLRKQQTILNHLLLEFMNWQQESMFWDSEETSIFIVVYPVSFQLKFLGMLIFCIWIVIISSCKHFVVASLWCNQDMWECLLIGFTT